MKKKILCILIILLIFIRNSFINNDNSINKVISYNNNLRISIDGESSNILPTSGTYYLADYSCNSNDTKVIWDKSTYKLEISNGTKKGEVSCNLEFKSKPLLNKMVPGDYVTYVGNNGCDNATIINGYTACSGKNVNYQSDDDIDSNGGIYMNGWRIGYIENGSTYLVSAGSLEKMCTDSLGIISSDSCSSGLSDDNLDIHLNNLNQNALKYCNSSYSDGGVCDLETTWSFNDVDFMKMMNGQVLEGCSSRGQSFACGYANDMIDNSESYWFTSIRNTTSYVYLAWNSANRRVVGFNSNSVIGIRPVIKLDSSVVVTGGSGTYDDPYQIGNNTFFVNNGVSTLNEDDNLSAVSLNLISSEDVSTMCISVDTSVCTNYVAYSDTYSLDMSSYNEGEHIIYVYYKDSSGNIIASMNKNLTINSGS